MATKALAKSNAPTKRPSISKSLAEKNERLAASRAASKARREARSATSGKAALCAVGGAAALGTLEHFVDVPTIKNTSIPLIAGAAVTGLGIGFGNDTLMLAGLGPLCAGIYIGMRTMSITEGKGATESTSGMFDNLAGEFDRL